VAAAAAAILSERRCVPQAKGFSMVFQFSTVFSKAVSSKACFSMDPGSISFHHGTFSQATAASSSRVASDSK
jgi:hypothetical protein